MGAAGSKTGSTERPFPLDPAQDKNLDKLSVIATRLLSLPDIYDLENIKRPGTCGDYAVFLKETLTQKLLPFVAEVDLGDGKGVRPVPVLYQNPRAIIKDDNARKQICSSIVETVLRTVATVLACLGSMQVASQSREVAVRGVSAQKGGRRSQKGGAFRGEERASVSDASMEGAARQRGGAFGDVYTWLQQNGYLDPGASSPIGADRQSFLPNNRVPMRIAGGVSSRTLSLTITFESLSYGYTNATVFAADSSKSVQPMPTGGIRIQFLDPITIPVGPGVQPQSVLPLRIVDSTGTPWAAGILYGGYFQSFHAPTPYGYLAPLLEILFRRTQGWQVSLPETRASINQANEVFVQLKRNPTAAVLATAVGSYLQRAIPGYQPGYVGAAAVLPAAAAGPLPYGVAAPTPFGAIAPGLPPPAGGFGAPGLGGLPPPAAYGAGAPGAYRPYGIIAPPAAGMQYQIPERAGSTILEILKRYRGALSRQAMLSNTPAAVRALTLSHAVDANTRVVQTNICQDPYWTTQTLGDVFPWGTLQFLCVKDWTTLTGERGRTTWEPEWDQFLTGLADIYNKGAPAGVGVDAGAAGGPAMTGQQKLDLPIFYRPQGATTLDQMSFQGAQRLKICESANSPRVEPREVERVLVELQGLYARHVKNMWEILNSLISVVVDPESNVEAVRLNPAITQGGQASAKYVAAKATLARQTIKDFYLEVERKYTEGIKSLRVV